MTELEHISQLGTDVICSTEERYKENLEEFYRDHHEGMFQWFELEWAELMLAEERAERLAALKKLRDKYWAIQKTG